MKKAILFLLIIVCAIPGFSQSNSLEGIKKEKILSGKSSLSGKVVDAKTGTGLQGATIFIHDIKVTAISGADGSFATSKFPSGKYLVEVSFVGYSTLIETVDLTIDATKDFQLSASVAEHEGVTVTGVGSATKLKQSAQPVTIVKRSDLLQTTSTNIIDALGKKVAGFSSLATGPAIAKPIIRGLGYNRVVVINDGMRQEGQQWGDEHGIEVDDNSIQKAEVIKGPASLMYGSDAMAGVVNLLTNVPVEQGTIKGNLGYNFIDNNGLNNFSGNLAGNLKSGFNWNVYGTYKSAKDYQNKYDGRVFNSRYNERNFGGYIGINKSWGFSHLLISNFNQHIGLVEGERDVVTGNFLIFGGTSNEREASNDELDSRFLFTPYQHINHFKVSSDNNFSIGKGRLAMNIGYQQNKRLEFGDADNPTKEDLFFDLKTITYNLQYHFADNNGWKTSIGINGMQQQNRNKAEEVLIPEYNQFDAGIFIYTKKTFNKLTVSGGIREDYRKVKADQFMEGTDVKFAAFSKNFSNTSGSIGLAYEASKQLTLKFNVARGYRAPSVAELSTNGIHEGTNRYEYGDNNLKTETSLQLDAGVEYNAEHLSFAVNAFYNSINNYIYYRKLEGTNGLDSIVVTPDGPATAFKFSQANAALYGFELKLDIHPHPLDWLHFENSFSFVAGTFGQSFEGTDKLPFMPAPKLQSELRGDFKKLGTAFKNFYMKLEMEHMAKQNNVFYAYNTETPTDGYALFNIGTGADINTKNKKLFSIYLALNNITDVAYQNHLSRLKYTAINNATGRQGVFNMGRNFSVKVSVPFSFKVK